MITASPLRYPGGKASIAGLLRQIRRLNHLGDRPVAEPFAGGAGASLRLLFQEETPEIWINDGDPSIHDFWWAVVHRSGQFLRTLAHTRVNMAEWRRQRDTYRSSKSSRLRRAFAVFYLNRCNRSGIIMNGGPIGGIKQAGKWKLAARYNKGGLTSRCAKVAEFRDRIHVSGDDGLDFIRRLAPASMFFFIDPPYFEKGKTLYLNALDDDYHAALAKQLRAMHGESWVLTYDDCPEIRRLYRGWANIRSFSLRYSAAIRTAGREVLITPTWMKLPEVHEESLAVAW